jgi:hypothetical protein
MYNLGRFVECRAAGLTRTLVFNPYPYAQKDGSVNIDFKIVLNPNDSQNSTQYSIHLEADNTDVHYIEDWSKVFQHDALVIDAEPEGSQWQFKTAQPTDSDTTFGNVLHGNAGTDQPLPQLSYPLDLKGWYAVMVSAPGAIRLRLSGDERSDGLSSRRGEEVLWRWAKMDRQNLVLKQPHRYTGYAPATIDYVKFIPLTPELLDQLNAPFEVDHDKFVASYWEPYSYAFHDKVVDSLWHREYLSAYSEAQVDLIDMQIGRMGMKVVYESRLTDNLYYATRGDPIGNVEHPQTDNVGRMQQFTNTLETSIRHADELGVPLHANFGASNSYPGSPLQGEISKKHPEWLRGSALRYEVPEVREYALSLYREALEIGAKGISLDFCRYPETIDKPETCNLFMKDIRALADEFGKERGTHIPILVRFPAKEVRKSKNFDFVTWVHEGWIDYLCPSNIQGRNQHFDITPYLEAVKGTDVTLLPVVDALGWGPTMPGPFLQRVASLYDAGVPGVYIYQGDARVLGVPMDRRTMRMLGSSDALNAWTKADAQQRATHSKGIYITPPMRVDGHTGWQRLRVWTEGIPLGKVELYLDGKLVSSHDTPPYLLGTEDYRSDKIIPSGEHELRIRAQDGKGWLEQTFTINGK